MNILFSFTLQITVSSDNRPDSSSERGDFWGDTYQRWAATTISSYAAIFRFKVAGWGAAPTPSRTLKTTGKSTTTSGATWGSEGGRRCCCCRTSFEEGVTNVKAMIPGPEADVSKCETSSPTRMHQEFHEFRAWRRICKVSSDIQSLTFHHFLFD